MKPLNCRILLSFQYLQGVAPGLSPPLLQKGVTIQVPRPVIWDHPLLEKSMYKTET